MKSDPYGGDQEQQVIFAVADNETFEQTEQRAAFAHSTSDYHTLLHQSYILCFDRTRKKLLFYRKRSSYEKSTKRSQADH